MVTRQERTDIGGGEHIRFISATRSRSELRVVAEKIVEFVSHPTKSVSLLALRRAFSKVTEAISQRRPQVPHRSCCSGLETRVRIRNGRTVHGHCDPWRGVPC